MEAQYYPTVMPKIITAADLCKYLEGCLGLTATVAQDSVKLLFRACVRALANSDAGGTLGIGLGNLLAVPCRRNVSGAWRPAFHPSRTFLRYLDVLQARACAGESLGRAFPQMHRKDLVELLVSGGVRRALADRIAKAAITFWFDRLVSGCAVELPGGVAQVTWRRTARIRRQAGGALKRGHGLVWAQRSRRRGDGPRYWLGVSFRSNRQFRSAGLGRVDIVRVQPDRSHIPRWVPGAAPPAVQESNPPRQPDHACTRAGFLGYGDEELTTRRSLWLVRMAGQMSP
jgi:hypothetical protein